MTSGREMLELRHDPAPYVAIETMLHGFCELDSHGRVTSASPSLLAMLPACEGKKLSRWLHVDDDWLRQQIALGSERKSHRVELETDGDTRPVLVELGPLHNAPGAGFAVVTDLAAETRDRRRIDELAEFAILRLDAEAHITFANEAACQILQVAPEEIIGLSANDLVSNPEELRRVEDQTALRREGVSSEYDVQIQPRNAEAPMHIRVRSMPEMDHEGQLSGIFVTIAPIDAERAAERIQEEVATRDDPDQLFDAVVGHLRSALPFGHASLAVYARGGLFSRVVRSLPEMETNQRWVPLPCSVQPLVEDSATVGADMGAFLRENPDRMELYENLGVQELIRRGMKSWASITLKGCAAHAVFSVLHEQEGYYTDQSLKILERTGIHHAMHRVLKLQAQRESDFQLALIKKMAQAQNDLALANIVVQALADFYGWQNVSIFKVNALHGEFQLLTQAVAADNGFRLPEGYRQPLDQGFLGKALRQGTVQLIADSHDPSVAKDFVVGSALTRSEMCVPIRVQGKVTWVLNIEDQRANAFEEPDQDAVERLMRELEPSLERALSAALLEQVLEDAPDAVVITNFDGAILRCNRAAAAIFGGVATGKSLADYFERGSKGHEVASMGRSERSVPIRATVVGNHGQKTEVLMRTRVPRDEYERRVVVFQDRQKIDWQAESRRLAALTSEARVPLSLISTFVRQIAKLTAKSAPSIAKLADHAAKQLGRVELTYDRLIEAETRRKRSRIDLAAVVAEIVKALPPIQQDLVQVAKPAERLPLLRCDQERLRGAVESMLAYMLRLWSVEDRVSARLQRVEAGVEIRLFKPRPAANGDDSTSAATEAAIDEARARAALDEPRLYQMAATHGGRFSRRRGPHGETLRLVLPTKGAGHV